MVIIVHPAYRNVLITFASRHSLNQLIIGEKEGKNQYCNNQRCEYMLTTIRDVNICLKKLSTMSLIVYAHPV